MRIRATCNRPRSDAFRGSVSSLAPETAPLRSSPGFRAQERLTLLLVTCLPLDRSANSMCPADRKMPFQSRSLGQVHRKAEGVRPRYVVEHAQQRDDRRQDRQPVCDTHALAPKSASVRLKHPCGDSMRGVRNRDDWAEMRQLQGEPTGRQDIAISGASPAPAGRWAQVCGIFADILLVGDGLCIAHGGCPVAKSVSSVGSCPASGQSVIGDCGTFMLMR